MSTTVAIIGAGVAGICAARACLARNLSVTVFDSRESFGGIWSGESSPVFDNLTTNTACFETCISDVPPPRVKPKGTLGEHDNLCMTSAELREYLDRVVKNTPGLYESVRFRRDVLAVRVVSEGYEVETAEVGAAKGVDGKTASTVEKFDYVIVATGIHHSPAILPADQFPGLAEFPGTVLHVSKYKHPSQFCGKRVLIVGGSVSGCEAAGDMAMAQPGERPGHITVSTRSMRYLALKQTAGRVQISEVSTRFHNLQRLAGLMWSEDYTTDMLEFFLSFSKNEDFNAPHAQGPIHLPGMPNWVPVNYKTLKASKEGLLEWNVGGVLRFKADGMVEFKNSVAEKFDVILLATGYHVRLPFLDEQTRKVILAEEAPDYFLDLADFSFHPELPRLAFIGMVPPGGAVAPMLDAQSRWIARVIAQPESRPRKSELWAGIETYRKQRTAETSNVVVFGYEVLDRFAELGGFEVDLAAYKEWAKAMIFGPLVPAQFRLFGDGKQEGALAEFERQITAAGYVKWDNEVEQGTLRRLEEVCTLLQTRGIAPKGLREAVDYLINVNFKG